MAKTRSNEAFQEVYLLGCTSSGRYERVWDGLGDDGRSVLPGLYLYWVQVDADGGREERSGLIPVVR